MMVITQYDTSKDQSMLTLYGLISKCIVITYTCGFLKCSHKYMALFKTEYSNMPRQLTVP